MFARPFCFLLLSYRESANRISVNFIMRPITVEHELLGFTGRKIFGSTRRPPGYIHDTFAVCQSFGNRPDSSEA